MAFRVWRLCVFSHYHFAYNSVIIIQFCALWLYFVCSSSFDCFTFATICLAFVRTTTEYQITENKYAQSEMIPSEFLAIVHALYVRIPHSIWTGSNARFARNSNQHYLCYCTFLNVDTELRLVLNEFFWNRCFHDHKRNLMSSPRKMLEHLLCICDIFKH